MRLRSNTLAPLLSLVIFVTLSVLAPQVTLGATVTQVKGSRVLIEAESPSELKANEKYFVTIGGKKKAIVQVTRVKGTRAIGRVLKGKAAVNGRLIPAVKGSTSSPAASSSASAGGSRNPFADLTVGVLGGYAMDQQDVNTTTGSASMTGSGFSGNIFGDLPFTKSMGLIARLGAEMFNVEGTLGGSNKKTSITYATADFLLRYSFMEGNFVPFVAAGVGLRFPLSKDSGVLETQKISSTSVFLGAVGVNFAFSKTMYFTALGEYGMFPPSNDVKTSFIDGRAGVGFRF